MASFTFPADKLDFTAANGITYTWDVGEEKWRVKTFKTDDPDTKLPYRVETEPAGDPQIQLVDAQDNFSSVKLVGTNGIDITTDGPDTLSLDGATLTPRATFEADQARQDEDIAVLDSDVTTLQARVTVGENVQNSIQGEQTVQNDQINALETQIQLLTGVKAVGKWTYRRRVESSAPRPPATSTFYGTHKDGIDNVLLSWSDTYLLMINKTDIQGNNFTFSDFEEGDKVEIIATDGSSAVYGTITNNPSNDVYANMIIDVERFRNGPVEEKEYLISAYRPGSSSPEVDLDILDGRYLVKTGDTMTGQLKLQQTQLSIVKEDGTQQYKINPNTSDHYTNIYSFNCEDGYGGVRLRVAPGNNTDGYKTFLQATFQEQTLGNGTHPVTTQLNWLRTPTVSHHAANKQYVDDSVGAANKPANWQWKWVGEVADHAPDTLQPGEYCGPQGNDTTGAIFYFSTKPYNSPNKIILDRQYEKSMEFPDSSGGPLMSTWYQGGDQGTGNEDTRDPNWYLQTISRAKKLTFYPYDNINANLSGEFFSIELHSGGGYNSNFYNVAKYHRRLYYISLAGVF